MIETKLGPIMEHERPMPGGSTPKNLKQRGSVRTVVVDDLAGGISSQKSTSRNADP